MSELLWFICIACFLLQYRRRIEKIEKQFKIFFTPYSRKHRFKKSWKMLKRLFEKSFCDEPMNNSSLGNFVFFHCCTLSMSIKTHYLTPVINPNVLVFFITALIHWAWLAYLLYFLVPGIFIKMTLQAKHLLSFLIFLVVQ